jgi:hypothetical protein
MRANKMDPMEAFTGMMNAYIQLSVGTPEQKAAMLDQIREQIGVKAPQQQAGDSNPFADPAVKALQEELAKTQNQLREIQGTQSRFAADQQAQVRAKLEAEVNAFFDDPKNIYVNELANDITALLKSGMATNIGDAYSKAMYLNPAVRAKEIERQARESAEKAAADAAAKAEAAKAAAATNVRSAPRSGGTTTGQVGSIDDTLQATLDQIHNRKK